MFLLVSLNSKIKLSSTIFRKFRKILGRKCGFKFSLLFLTVCVGCLVLGVSNVKLAQ